MLKLSLTTFVPVSSSLDFEAAEFDGAISLVVDVTVTEGGEIDFLVSAVFSSREGEVICGVLEDGRALGEDLSYKT